MKLQKIYHYYNRDLVFESIAPSLKKCVEKAVDAGIDLSGADLSHANLRDVNLDDAIMTDVNFRDADLRGANMSEGTFEKCDFSNALMHGACLNESRFEKSAFLYTRFGDTDCAGTNFIECYFGGVSCFSLRFFECATTHKSLYFQDNRKSYSISEPPLVIQGLKKLIVLLDTHYLYGSEIAPHSRLFGETDTQNWPPGTSSVSLNATDLRHIILAFAYETGRFKKSCN